MIPLLKFDKYGNGDGKTIAKIMINRSEHVFLQATCYANHISFWIMDKDGYEIETIGFLDKERVE